MVSGRKGDVDPERGTLTIYVNSEYRELLEKAKRTFPDMNRSELFWTALQQMVDRAE